MHKLMKAAVFDVCKTFSKIVIAFIGSIALGSALKFSRANLNASILRRLKALAKAL